MGAEQSVDCFVVIWHEAVVHISVDNVDNAGSDVSAAKLIDKMEQMAIVGPPDGNKPRQVLLTRQEYMEMVLAKQKVELNDLVDRDVINYYIENGYLSLNIFFIRHGKLLGNYKKKKRGDPTRCPLHCLRPSHCPIRLNEQHETHADEFI